MRKIFLQSLFLSLIFLLLVAFGLTKSLWAKEFDIGLLSLKDYDGYYYFLDLENLTQTNLGVATDFEQIEISFFLDDGTGFYQNNYVITLANPNEDNVYDDLTWLWFSSYDSQTNTYYDGEDIAALPDGETILNLVNDPYNSALLIDPNLYIKDLSLAFDFTLNNFVYTENGVDYVFSGTVSYQGTLLDDQWYLISDLGTASWSTPLKVDIQGTPLGGAQPIPEPATVSLLAFGLAFLWFIPRVRRG